MTIFMAAATFIFVLLGTFITRSGIINSVHAFQEDPLSYCLFLTMMVGSLVVTVIGIVYRWDKLKGSGGFERLFSKDGSYYLNNVIMLFAAFIVAYLTMAQAFWSWVPLGGRVFGAATYDILARPSASFTSS